MAYFFFVASPPLICLSDLLAASSSVTLLKRVGFTRLNVFETSLCTVLLLMPKYAAALLTVALFSSIYIATVSHRSFPDDMYIIYLPLLYYTMIIYVDRSEIILGMDLKMQNTDNRIFFEGITSVSALVSAQRTGKSRRRILRVYFEKSKIRKEHGRFQFLRHASEELGFELLTSEEEEIAAMSSGKTHGGILAEVTEAEYQAFNPEAIPENGFCAIIEGVEDPYSLGYSLRTLYACGCNAVVLPRHLPSAADSTLCKASAGASELLEVFMGDTAEIAMAYKQAGYKIACAEIRDSVACFDADLKFPLLLIIGGEKRGISSKLSALKDINVRIPYARDFLGSLSTASAVSILAYEVVRQNFTTN